MGELTAWSKIIPSRQQKFLHERAKKFCGATIVVGQSKRKALESGGSKGLEIVITKNL